MNIRTANLQLANNIKNYIQVYIATLDTVGKMLDEEDIDSAKEAIGALKGMSPIVLQTVDEVQQKMLFLK